MKSLGRSVFFLFYAIVLLMTCSKDDDVNPLAGTWTLKAGSTQNCKDPNQNVSITYLCDDASCIKYSFKAGGTLTVEQISNGVTATTTGTYSISGTTVTTNLPSMLNLPAVRSFTYTVSGSTLYLKEIINDLSGRCSPTIVLNNDQ